jgi:hypothetical protein
MKIKVAIASLAVATVVVAAFAFKAPKFVTTDFYYKANNDYQRIEPGHNSELDVREQSIEVDGGVTFKDVAKWQTSPVSYTSTTQMNQFIGKISFNLDAVNPANGGADGDLTLQEALNALYARFTSTSAMPSALTVDNCTITVEAANAAH